MLTDGLVVGNLEAGHCVGIQVGGVVGLTTCDPVALHIVREVVTVEPVGVVVGTEEACGKTVDDLVGRASAGDDTVDVLLVDVVEVVTGVSDGLGVGVVVPETGGGVAVAGERRVVGSGTREDTCVDPILVHEGSHDVHLEGEPVIQTLLLCGHAGHVVGVACILHDVVTLPDTDGSVDVGPGVAGSEGKVVVVLGNHVVDDPIHPVGVIAHVDTCTAELAGVECAVLAGVEDLELLVGVGDTELTAVLDL